MTFDIEIDGSIGGGSVLRVAVPLALGLNKSIKITNIRGQRKKPGLRNQHLLGLTYLAEIANYSITGNSIGSQIVTLIPNREPSGKINPKMEINTAASVSLIIQALCNYSFTSKKNIDFEFIGGGTHTNWSPNFDYVQEVTKSVFREFGLELNIELERKGFFPKGEAVGVINIVNDVDDKRIDFKNTAVCHLKLLLCASSNLKQVKVLERQRDQFLKLYEDEYSFSIETNIDYTNTSSAGTSATIVIYYEESIPKGISILGEKGVSSEKIGKRLFEQFKLINIEEASIDQFMSDQIILPLALSMKGNSATIPKLTDHVKVNIDIINKILGKCIVYEETAAFVRLIRV